MAPALKTKLWIVTGGIGTGKSEVCRLLAAMNPAWARFSSDESVAQAYSDPGVRAAVHEAFGMEVPPEGITKEQRARLREFISSSETGKARLESILHPYVFRQLGERLASADKEGSKVLVAEVPLYYETGRAVAADCVIAVAASKASQIERLCKSRGLNEEAANRMLDLQLPIETKTALADVVIWNDGSLTALERQVRLMTEQIPRK